MEVEVKLRLPDAAAHQKLTDLLSPFHTQTFIQENIFFDGSNSELSSNRAIILRLRFYDVTSRCVLSLKAKPIISNGVSRAQELEEPFDPVFGRACVAESWRLTALHSSALLNRVREEYGVGELGFVCMGGFRNVRGVYEWKGLKIEVDESNYDFGTCYEVECETSNPERDKKVLEKLLEENGIRFQYSDVSKFAIFRSGKLPCLIESSAVV